MVFAVVDKHYFLFKEIKTMVFKKSRKNFSPKEKNVLVSGIKTV